MGEFTLILPVLMSDSLSATKVNDRSKPLLTSFTFTVE